jgi:diketogulonate reductase-like aldo/keto reductase
MRYETLYNGRKIPVIGLGTWNIGGGMVSDYFLDGENVRIIQTAIEMGYTHIDTAQMYGSGHTEELVGKAIKSFKREDLFITTKVWSSDLRYRDVMKRLEESLRRLGSHYVDLYLIHWPNPAIPLKETMKAFDELVHLGKARYIGVSNFSLEQLKQAQQLSNAPIATNQVEYNIFSREPERNGLLRYCQENNIILTAYEPFGKGSVLHDGQLQRIASRNNVTAAQLALYWLLSKPKVITIPKSSNRTHLKENLDVLQLEVTAQVMDQLSRM